jgi:hypothetical protein
LFTELKKLGSQNNRNYVHNPHVPHRGALGGRPPALSLTQKKHRGKSYQTGGTRNSQSGSFPDADQTRDASPTTATTTTGHPGISKPTLTDLKRFLFI